MEILNNNMKKFHILLAAFIVGDSLVKQIDGYLLSSYINQKYIVKVKLFVTANTDYMCDHIRAITTLRDFKPNAYISHVVANDLLRDCTRRDI